jgi:hypothetical protein
MHFSRKEWSALAAVLGVSALSGWWAGAFYGGGGGFAPHGRIPLQAQPGIAGSKTTDPTVVPAGPAEATELSGEESTLLQKELLTLLREGKDSGEELIADELLMMRQVARAAYLFSKLSRTDQENVFGELPESQRGEAFMMVKMFSGLMSPPKPPADSGYAKQLAGPQEEIERMVTLSTWGAHDPKGLLHYYKTEFNKPDAPEWLKSHMGNAVRDIGLADPRLLLQEAMAADDPSLRQSMLQMLHLNGLYAGQKSQWTAENDGLLKQLMAQLPDRRENELSGVLAMRMKSESPEEARAWVESLDLGPESKAWTDKALFSAWRMKDRNAAAQWMLDQTPLEQKADRIAEYVSWWTGAKVPKENRLMAPEPDIAACADWILSLGISPDTEKGISVLAEGWIQSGEPAAALAWAQAISDPDTRTSCLEKVTIQIERRYPDTWRAMLAAAGIPGA